MQKKQQKPATEKIVAKISQVKASDFCPWLNLRDKMDVDSKIKLYEFGEGTNTQYIGITEDGNRQNY